MSPTRWYAVRTNPRCEERAVASMEEAGFSVYAPKLRKVIIHHRSKKVLTREFPMLVGYVFVELDAKHPPFGFVRECDGVRGFVGVTNTPTPLADIHMQALQEIEGSEWLRADLAFRQPRKLGRHKSRGMPRITISSGPLSGFIGHVVNDKDRNSVKLITSFFAELVEIAMPEREIDRAA